MAKKRIFSECHCIELKENTEVTVGTHDGKSPIVKTRQNAGSYRFCAACTKALGKRVMHPHDVTCDQLMPNVTSARQVAAGQPLEVTSNDTDATPQSGPSSEGLPLELTPPKPLESQPVTMANGQLEGWRSPKQEFIDIVTDPDTESVDDGLVVFHGKQDKSMLSGAHAKVKKISPLEVMKLTTLGATVADIAQRFGVHEETIRRRFAWSLEKGRSIRHLSLRQRQTEVAMSNGAGATAMLIFLGKNELGKRLSGVKRPKSWTNPAGSV